MGKDVLFSHHLEPRKKKKEKKNWQRETPIMEIGKCEYHPSYFWTNQMLELIRSRSRSAPVRSWFLERSANFYSSLLRENSTDAITKITFCIFWFENLICGLDWDGRTSQELDFRLITTTKNSLKFTYPGQRLNTSSLFCYTLLPGWGRGYSPIKVTGVLVVPFRGLNLWIGTA